MEHPVTIVVRRMRSVMQPKLMRKMGATRGWDEGEGEVGIF